MRTRIKIIAASLLAVGLVLPSCQKALSDPSGDCVSLGVEDALLVSTKTTALYALPSKLYWSATSGAAGSETSVRAVSMGNVVAGRIATDLQQIGTAYNYYVSNVTTSFSAAKTTMNVSNTTDAVYGRCALSTSTDPVVTLNHVFGRTGSFTVYPPEGVVVQSANWKIKGKSAINGTSGVFNLTTGAFESASTTLAERSVNSSTDLYLIPGTYTVTCSFVLRQGGATRSLSCSADVPVVAGKILLVELHVKQMAIEFSYSIDAWGEKSASLDDLEQKPYALQSFGGLYLTPAPLIYDNGTLRVFGSDWNQSSYGEAYGMTEGSTYFSFTDMGNYFDSRGSAFTTANDIDNNGSLVMYAGYDDWRMPTRAEWATITTGVSPGTLRSGSTINDVPGCRYALIQLIDVTHENRSPIYGILLAPDDCTMTGMSRTFTWNVEETTGNTGASVSELQEYLDRGCVFLPECGSYDTNWSSSNYKGTYWMAESMRVMDFDTIHIGTNAIMGTNSYLQVRLVRRADDKKATTTLPDSINWDS